MNSIARHLMWLDLRHDLFRWAVFSSVCSLLLNFLPNCRVLDRWPRWQVVYVGFIDVVAFFAFAWRTCYPSLDWEILGFRIRRTVEHYAKFKQYKRHRSRNALQEHIDRNVR